MGYCVLAEKHLQELDRKYTSRERCIEPEENLGNSDCSLILIQGLIAKSNDED